MTQHGARAAVKEEFSKTFPAEGKIHVIRAPGRVNLIGEHTDYNQGLVFPMAIEPEVLVACRGRNDGKVRLASTIYPNQLVEFSVQEKIQRGQPQWANYCKGVAAELLAAGIPLTGMDALISNTLPPGGGLSSSAALEVATAFAFLTLTGAKLDLTRLALLCQKAEHDFAGVPVGLMDQMIVSSARAGHATLFDCRSLSREFVPLDDKELRVVIVNSMVKHDLASGEYAKRRKECEQGVEFFRRENPQIKSLRDVTTKMLDGAQGKLPDIIFRRCRHVVSENLRTEQAAAALAQKRYEQFGELMVQSHNSLRDDYQVSAEELDYLVAESMKIKGVYGARMTGGGFGGCIVALTQPNAVDTLTSHLNQTYPHKFKKTPTIFATTATAGACTLE